jgi:26S proteasome regulatory subunit N2
MEAVLDTGFKLSYRDEVLHFLLPLFPPPSPQTPHIYALTRLLVTLSDASLTVPLFISLVPDEKLLAYQFAFDFVEGGSQEFLEAVRNGLPIDVDEVWFVEFLSYEFNNAGHRWRRIFTTIFAKY